MGGGGQELEDIVDLIFETAGEHFVGFIEDEHFDVIGAEGTAVLNHVQYTSWRADNNMDAFLKDSDILSDNRTSNTRVALRNKISEIL